MLDGVLVVSLEQAVAAPLTTSRLADAGARVIKLERYEGDFARGYDQYVNGSSTYFVWLNRGKQSCRVDLKSADDFELVNSMLASADIFVQNLAPGATDRLGLGAKQLLQRYPGLIVCDISGYPANSPYEKRKAYDLLIQAESGLASVTGSAESGPSRVGVSLCDIATGQAAYAAILEALIRKRQTGKGSHLQVSLFDTLAEFMNVPFLTYSYGGIEPSRVGLSHPSIAPYGVFRLADGEVLISIQNDREWIKFCSEVIDRPQLANDPNFSSNVKRVENRVACDSLIQDILKQQSSDSVRSLLDAAGIAYGFISTVVNLRDHPAGSFLGVYLPDGSQVDILAPPVQVDGQRSAATKIPGLGEHDAAIRAEFCNQ